MSASLQNRASIANNEKCALAWKITAQFCSGAHPRINSPESLLEPNLSPAYVRDLLLARLQLVRDRLHTMRSITLFSFIMPRNARTGDTVPVTVILHGPRVLGQSAVEALLSGTHGCTATCTPLDFGPGTNYCTVSVHPAYMTFLKISSKLKWPDVDARLYQRIDIEGNSDARQENTFENEEKFRPWKFTATFDPSIHKELVRVVDERLGGREVSTDYIASLLNTTIVASSELLTFAVEDAPLDLSKLITVQGFLKGRSQIRRRTVQEVFPVRPGLTVDYTPLHMGRGTAFTSHKEFVEYIRTSTKDRAEAITNPNLLFRVDIRRETDSAQPKKRGPRPGPRTAVAPLESDLNSLLPGPLRKRCRNANAAPTPPPSMLCTTPVTAALGGGGRAGASAPPAASPATSLRAEVCPPHPPRLPRLPPCARRRALRMPPRARAHRAPSGRRSVPAPPLSATPASRPTSARTPRAVWLPLVTRARL